MSTVSARIVGPLHSQAVHATGDELRRDLIEVALVSSAAELDPVRDERAIVIVWFDGAIDAITCQRHVAWADERRPRQGLIAVAMRAQPSDAEIALDAGFDDAVAGPRSTRELAARVRAVHRRIHVRGPTRLGRLRHGRITVDLDSHELRVEGRTFSLTPNEMAIVRALIRAVGRTMTRSQLLDAAWGTANFEVSERAVDNVILRLRRKLGDVALIRTVRGIGFRIDGELA